MIDIKLLKQLVTLYETKTITNASRKLKMSQPALTRSMQKLEKLLKIELFLRSKNKLEFSKSGLIVVKKAQKLLNQTQKFMDDIEQLNLKKHTIFIGTCALSPQLEMANRLKTKQIPYKLNFQEMPNELLLTNLLNEKTQISFTDQPLKHTNIYSIPIFKEQLHIVLPLDNELANHASVNFQDLSNHKILVYKNLGVWEDIFTHTLNLDFIKQQDIQAFNDLIVHSNLPYFSTNITQDYYGLAENKVEIPINEPLATKTFYINCLKKNKYLLKYF